MGFDRTADEYTVAQAVMNASALFATVSGPLTIGALTKRNAHTGWRDFYVGLPCGFNELYRILIWNVKVVPDCSMGSRWRSNCDRL